MMSKLVCNARYPHPPERVWQALTHPKALATWMMDNNFEPSVGHRFQFKETSLPGLNTVIDCEVIALEPPRRLVYTWQTEGMPTPSLVTWTLTPIEDGTQLQMHHSGLTQAAIPLQPTSPLPQEWHGSPEKQVWHQPQVRLAIPPHSLQSQPETAGSVEPHALLQMTFEHEWNHRLNELLPKVLDQLVAV
ncbi:MAG: SRPBCC domain-containing protein [Cyanobacteria bacterium J06639_14]